MLQYRSGAAATEEAILATPRRSALATLEPVTGSANSSLTFQFQGRHFRLTDVHGELVQKILS